MKPVYISILMTMCFIASGCKDYSHGTAVAFEYVPAWTETGVRLVHYGDNITMPQFYTERHPDQWWIYFENDTGRFRLNDYALYHNLKVGDMWTRPPFRWPWQPEAE